MGHFCTSGSSGSSGSSGCGMGHFCTSGSSGSSGSSGAGDSSGSGNSGGGDVADCLCLIALIASFLATFLVWLTKLARAFFGVPAENLGCFVQDICTTFAIKCLHQPVFCNLGFCGDFVFVVLFNLSVIDRLLGLESKFIRKVVDGFSCFFGADLEKLENLRLFQDLSEGLTSLARGVNLVQNFLHELVGITFLLRHLFSLRL